MRGPAAHGNAALAASVGFLLALIAAGFVAVVLAWKGAASHDRVAEQIPYVVSGGFGGIALIGVGLGVLMIQHRRWTEARWRNELERACTAAPSPAAAHSDWQDPRREGGR